LAHPARKRFGQHFLTDHAVIERIVAAIRPLPDDCMVEIGPGLEALTRPLLQRVRKLHVVEIDRDIVARLRLNHADEKLVIHSGDALFFDFGSLGADLRVVGNLPYNISTPLLFYLAEFARSIRDMTFMLQKEVVQRMVAAPATSEYGRLSVMLQYRFAMEALFIVPPQAFDPPPKVESALVRIVPRPDRELRAHDTKRFAGVVAAAFGQRRKTLRNTLQGWLQPEDFIALGIDPGLRAEALPVERFVAISNHLTPGGASQQ
jgi:16S rRNA (adenine1518-N6/adenine1519-N6)-dimethyltransferase